MSNLNLISLFKTERGKRDVETGLLIESWGSRHDTPNATAVYTHICIYVCVYSQIHFDAYSQTHAITITQTHAHMRTRARPNTHMHTHAHVHTHTHGQTRTHTHTHTHTHMYTTLWSACGAAREKAFIYGTEKLNFFLKDFFYNILTNTTEILKA